MRYLKIKNNGHIEDGALTLIGASDKRDKSKIGMFGSGNKYALAFLMREGYNIQIFSGKREIKLSLKEKSFREEVFKVIHVNGEPTSITTEMGGIDWSLWQAIREIYANAVDEGGQYIGVVDDINPTEEETHFYIPETKEVKEIIENFDRYFVVGDRRVVAKTPLGRILEKSGEYVNIYRRGIRCFDKPVKSAYDYDFDNIDINESRTVIYPWRIIESMWKMAFHVGDEEVLNNMFSASSKSDHLERETSLVNLDDSYISPEFKLATNNTTFGVLEYAGLVPEEDRDEYAFIPKPVFKAITGKNEDDLVNFHDEVGPWREIEMTPYHKTVINNALKFLKECRWHDIPYDIKVAVFEKQVLGMASGNNIYLSDYCLDAGVQLTVETIIEEYVHLKTGAEDCSRMMQNKLIQELILYMKKQNAYVL